MMFESQDSLCRLLFVSKLDETVASHRFRVLKLLPILREVGIDASIFYVPSRLEARAMPSLIAELLRCRKIPQLVVFQKTVSFAIARLCKIFGAKLLTDIDDGGRRRLDGTLYPDGILARVERWIRFMDAVVVSTVELKQWIQSWNDRVRVVPTCLDVENYSALTTATANRQRPVIGWMGYRLPQNALVLFESALLSIVKRFDAEVVLVGGEDPSLDPRIGAEFLPWRLSLEPDVLGKFDIGLNPLPYNERARMKAGFKTLQYMAAGLPVVASPVGANREIIDHGWNGFLADSVEEWEAYLEELICDSRFRRQMGIRGREFAQNKYRLEVAADLWRNLCCELLGD